MQAVVSICQSVSQLGLVLQYQNADLCHVFSFLKLVTLFLGMDNFEALLSGAHAMVSTVQKMLLLMFPTEFLFFVRGFDKTYSTCSCFQQVFIFYLFYNRQNFESRFFVLLFLYLFFFLCFLYCQKLNLHSKLSFQDNHFCTAPLEKNVSMIGLKFCASNTPTLTLADTLTFPCIQISVQICSTLQ